jgi:hypothetical protein
MGRIMSHKQPEALSPYMLQSLMLLIAPSLYAASVYMVLGRLMRVIAAEKYSLFPVQRLTKMFVLGDVFSFFLQSGGGGMMASGSGSMTDTGEKMIIGGLVAQILFFALFMTVTVVFHVRVSSRPTVLASTLQRHGKRGWLTLLYVLYGASFFILVRCVFRLIEYVQGNDGDILHHEIYMYLFDSCLILGATILFNVVHPSQVVPGGNGIGQVGSGSSRYEGTRLTNVPSYTA